MRRITFVMLVLAIAAIPARPAVAQVVPPRPPVKDSAPPLRPRSGGPAPVRPATRAVPSSAQTPAARATLKAVARGGRGADSTRPAVLSAARTPPARAAVICGDGTFATATQDTTCRAHQSVKGHLPHDAGPPVHAATSAPDPAVARSMALANSSAPSGATARCKDGTWLTTAPSPTSCATNGGVAFAVPPQRGAPPVPPRPAAQLQKRP